MGVSETRLSKSQRSLIAERRKEARKRGEPVDHLTDAEVWRAITLRRFLLR